MLAKRWLPLIGVVLLAAAPPSVQPAETVADQIDFFEKRIRPVLVEHCYKCHSAQSDKLKGNLYVDSREGLLKGGDTGPAIVPGNPDRSLILKAISYTDADLKMPPEKNGGKLAGDQIADLKTWLNQGAVWPRQEAKSSSKVEPFDLEKRRREHWAWQPAKIQSPPAVKNSRWPFNPVDRFIEARLEANKLNPAPMASRRTLIRRATFDLTGLPPAPDEIEAFVTDKSDVAFIKVVDRLLSSPRFGERWARHWLDRVRYSETMGHEFDPPVLDAWQYRDYVIRALNDDVPYDQFVMENIAGDLLPNPRIDPMTGMNHSAVGTAFYWFCQQVHSPVDVRQEQSDVIENQIDVISKAFLAMTVACARCHDHKFDAIPTGDFYSLYGILSSSRYTARILNDRAIEAAAKSISPLKDQLKLLILKQWEREAAHFASHLLAAAPDSGVSGPALSDASRDPSHPLHVWSILAKSGDFFETKTRILDSTRMKSRAADVPEPELEEQYGFSSWYCDGSAFSRPPAGDFIAGSSADRPVLALIAPGELNSARTSYRLQGEVRSPTFTISNRYIHVLAAGKDARLRLVLDNFTLIRGPIYDGLHHVIDSDTPRWVTFDLAMWPGHRAYLELADTTSIFPTEDTHSPKSKGKRDENGFASISRVVFSEAAQPPVAAPWPARAVVGSANSLADLANNYQRDLLSALASWRSGLLSSEEFGLLDWALRSGVLHSEPTAEIDRVLKQIHEQEDRIPEPIYVASMTEGTPLDEPVFIRGSHRRPGALEPRHFLEAIDGPQPRPFSRGSGRLELAQRIADSSNPLTARVMVNNVWHHLFGRGIIPSVDNFGVLGEKPTHPELLDFLAAAFSSSPPGHRDFPEHPAFGWSIKKLIRFIMLSRSYQMASEAGDGVAEERDPNNLLWHRTNLRRLEGEAIRDSMLAISGRLDESMFGPSVPIHLTPFMDGRGRPSQSGPLDGNGRRSIYVEVRRNFLSPMMLAFDTPIPATTVGKRAVSNVPAQALILMNDPFVIEQARIWARNTQHGAPGMPSDQITRLYLAAYGRPPTAQELAAALGFLDEQSRSFQTGADQTERAWADLCHVIFNTKEFIFLN